MKTTKAARNAAGRIRFEKKDNSDRRRKMQRLRRVRERLPRGSHRYGRRQGAAYARRLLRRPRRLPAGLPDGGDKLRRAPRPRPTTRRAAEANVAAKRAAEGKLPCGCPRHILARAEARKPRKFPAPRESAVASRLSQWPVQIKLAPVRAPYFDGAKLLVAADCTAFARADFHERFIKGRVTLVGCPKTRWRGLRGEADGDNQEQRHKGRDRRAHGGTVLRRHRGRGEAPRLWQAASSCRGRSSPWRSTGKFWTRRESAE